jgi:aspartyl protease family protein
VSPAPDPWGGRGPRRPSIGPATWWLALLGAVAALVAFLVWRYPDALTSQRDWASVTFLVALLAMVSAGVLAGRRFEPGSAVKQAAIWVSIALLLVIGYSFHVEIGRLGERVAGQLLPHRGTVVEEGTITFRVGNDGHFRVEATVDSKSLRFLVDTGASDVVLSPVDARRLGFDVSELNFTRFYETANGLVRGAPVRLEEVKIGPIVVNSSLLGMSFFGRLRYYEVRDGTLTLGQ